MCEKNWSLRSNAIVKNCKYLLHVAKQKTCALAVHSTKSTIKRTIAHLELSLHKNKVQKYTNEKCLINFELLCSTSDTCALIV